MSRHCKVDSTKAPDKAQRSNRSIHSAGFAAKPRTFHRSSSAQRSRAPLEAHRANLGCLCLKCQGSPTGKLARKTMLWPSALPRKSSENALFRSAKFRHREWISDTAGSKVERSGHRWRTAIHKRSSTTQAIHSAPVPSSRASSEICLHCNAKDRCQCEGSNPCDCHKVLNLVHHPKRKRY